MTKTKASHVPEVRSIKFGIWNFEFEIYLQFYWKIRICMKSITIRFDFPEHCVYDNEKFVRGGKYENSGLL